MPLKSCLPVSSFTRDVQSWGKLWEPGEGIKSPNTKENLGRDYLEAASVLVSHKHLGPVDQSTLTRVDDTLPTLGKSESSIVPHILVCQSLDDIESAARQKLSRKAWVYYDSAADGLHSFRTNRLDWAKISFRPRVLRNVARVNMQRRILGHVANLPFFIAPAAMAKLGHQDGELCLAKGAAEKNIVYCSSTYSSISHEELAPCFDRQEGRGALSFQLYVPKSKGDSRALIERAKALGCKSLVITVDTPVVGKREEDDRYKAELEIEEGREVPRTTSAANNEEAPILRGYHSSTVDWDDILWMRKAWGSNQGPVVLKGIQTAEDAYLACLTGVDGIYLSNHGGRQLDFAPSAIRTLLEIHKFYPQVLDDVEVYLDGGVRRGSDIVKALCLGARGVGLGRPFLYGLSAYGTEGVVKAIEILSDEIETAMRLLGVTDLDQLNPHYVNCSLLAKELPENVTPTNPMRQHKL
ncbi:hypothetical protein LTR10_023040 [Elasticomyces elasticus]|uniref:FMN hydroxy acid dehydrogenase domain-containing protein n=1 Tax=Exophiala sideris TaxID=1016849 RepID=A0ABR0IV76_9EURO|nr:hypothetical protein LTR10_023040 [Elasticomyces elasticus]KAK5021038.1 hypothetical protein LTS07_011293 [Exophiala sideris]KAK5023321.1 hypothetical protein LTR13_011233 [Exophiala sideris]KAK5048764.1 hypothetical protein LTR69_011310 [Exophiala sideris]KAK5176172.1 hypothetical protein LTR44_011267 [Eurotiomycetes sp. CCFEE 6388]